MSLSFEGPVAAKPLHPWLQRIHVSFVPGPMSPLMEATVQGLLRHFHRLGHVVQDTPTDETDVILTSAPFGEPLSWREGLLFTARRRFGLRHSPTLFTLMQVPYHEFRRQMDHFATALAKEPPDPGDYCFPGLAPQAWRVLVEQGCRGGPILTLQRLVQAQAKSIRVILVVGDGAPIEAYHFDLVGAYPRSDAGDIESFYEDIVLRIVTTVSTEEVTQHQLAGEPVSRATWQGLSTPAAMRTAGQQLGKRQLFTQMIRIADLVQVPAVSDSVASQYSEGCFATWDPTLAALIATVTGSARPVDKGNITEDDLAVIVGVRPDGKGALVRHVEGKRNVPPSSEAVEMMDVDSALPRVALDPEWGISARVPVVRSKLHGHRGVAVYDPHRVEYVPLDPAYYHYLVSCATDAQARGIKVAFSRSEAFGNPEDPRQVVFTVLPGHGLVLGEKWVPGAAPYQTIWEYMDAGYLQIDNRIPQGVMGYALGTDGRMWLRAR